MSVSELAINDKIRDMLGETGLRDLSMSLWAVDCQTCGGFLGEEVPALCVDDYTIFAHATLHHQSCRAPQWNDSGGIIAPSGDHISYLTRMLMLPFVVDGRKQTRTAMLINPGLEAVILEPDENQQWRVRLNNGFTEAGLLPAGKANFAEPAKGATAFVSNTSIAVTFESARFGVYEAPAEPQFRDRAHAFGGIVVCVTHVLHPGKFDKEDFGRALASGQILTGWVPLHGAATVPAQTDSPLGVTCVLHWTGKRMSVGTQVDRLSGSLSSKRARAWAERLITASGDRIIPWRLVDDGNPEDGWHTLTVLSANSYLLRRYPDGWMLVRAFSQVLGSSVESDNEAKAWAGEVLRFKAGVTGLSWEPGPTIPGSHTLYAKA